MPRITSNFSFSDIIGPGLRRIFTDAYLTDTNNLFLQDNETSSQETPKMKRCWKEFEGRRCGCKVIKSLIGIGWECNRKWPCGRPMHKISIQEYEMLRRDRDLPHPGHVYRDQENYQWPITGGQPASAQTSGIGQAGALTYDQLRQNVNAMVSEPEFYCGLRIRR